MYTLSLDSNFAPFLAEDATWGKKTKAQPLCSFTNDGEDVPLPNAKQPSRRLIFWSSCSVR